MKYFLHFVSLKTIESIAIIAIILATIITLFFDDEDDFAGKKYHGLTLDNFLENLYFSVVSLAAIGYGDIHPQSFKARSLMTVMGIYVLSFFMEIF